MKANGNLKTAGGDQKAPPLAAPAASASAADVLPLTDEALVAELKRYEDQIAQILQQEAVLLNYHLKRLGNPDGLWQLRRDGPRAGRELFKVPAPRA